MSTFPTAGDVTNGTLNVLALSVLCESPVCFAVSFNWASVGNPGNAGLLVFDPRAPLFQYQNAIIEPVSGSPFTAAEAVQPGNLVGFGAYVDLGWDDNEDYVSSAPPFVAAGAQLPPFQQERRVGWYPRITSSSNPIRQPPATYDTWSYHYEHDGIDQDPGNANPALSNIVDQGANGLDDDGVNGVDDIGERETSPPYLAPLRGMQVKLRIYEPNTRQIRQATVTSSFVP